MDNQCLEKKIRHKPNKRLIVLKFLLEGFSWDGKEVLTIRPIEKCIQII